jgi:hypothetical protein
MKQKLIFALAIAALAIAPMAIGADTAAKDSTLGVTVAAEASFTAVDAATTLTKSDTLFAAYTGTTNFTYKIRTTLSGGTGTITVMVTTFGTGGPAVADLSFVNTAPTSGTPVTASAVASTTVAGAVVGFGADAHSADTGDSGTTVWTLADRTGIKTGAYSSTATFTIAAL